jgi:hypothetical protein
MDGPVDTQGPNPIIHGIGGVGGLTFFPTDVPREGVRLPLMSGPHDASSSP